MSAANVGIEVDIYAEPDFISIPSATGKGELSLLNTGGGTNGATATLGDLAPAAGGTSGDLGSLEPSAGGSNQLGQLAPAAGGIAGNQEVNCANAYLDDDWAAEPQERDCDLRENQQPQQ